MWVLLPVVFKPSQMPTPLCPWWPSAGILTTIFLIGKLSFSRVGQHQRGLAWPTRQTTQPEFTTGLDKSVCLLPSHSVTPLPQHSLVSKHHLHRFLHECFASQLTRALPCRAPPCPLLLFLPCALQPPLAP